MSYQKIFFIKPVDTEIHSDMPGNSNNPCLNCGACCEHFRISFYFGETSAHSGGGVPSELTEQLTPYRAVMKGTSCSKPRCIALEGEVGTKIGCTIYENRPSVCRAYHVWDPESGLPNPKCQQLRQNIGLPLLEPIAVA